MQAGYCFINFENICFCFSIDGMSCIPNGQDTAPDKGEGAEESDSETTGSHYSASNEEIGDVLFSLHAEDELIEQMEMEPLNTSVPENSPVPKIDISHQLKVQTPENEKGVVKGANDDETVETVDKMDCSTSIEPGSQLVDNDSQHANKNKSTKDDDDEKRSITSVASTATIAAGLGDVQISHFAQISPDSKEETKGMQSDKSETEEASALDDDVIHESLQPITQHNESERSSIASTTDAQNTNFEQRRRCLSDAVAEYTNSCEREDCSTETNNVVVQNNASSLMRYKRRNSMEKIESSVPECKKRELDLVFGNLNMTSSAKRTVSLKAGSFEQISDANVSREASNNGTGENLLNTEQLFTKSADFVPKKVIVNLDRLHLDGKNSVEPVSVDVLPGYDESGQPMKSELEFFAESSEKTSCEDTLHHENEVFEMIDGENFWNWSFQVSANVDKFRKNTERLYFGVGTYLKSRKKKIRPPTFEFFCAETRMDTDNSRMDCCVKIPFSQYEEQDFFYSFFCITHCDEPIQNFEDLVASVTTEHDKIYNNKFVKSKDWGVLEFKKCTTKTKNGEKANKNAPNKKKEKIAIPKSGKKDIDKSMESDEEVSEEEILEVKDVVGNKTVDCIENVNSNQMVLNAIFGHNILSLGCRRLLICVATSLDNFTKLRTGWIVSSFGNSLWLRFHIPFNQARVQYKYCVVENLNYTQDRCYEILHEDGYVNRVLQASDFRDSVEKVKFDGHVKFGGTKGEHKKGFFDRIKSALPKWMTTKKGAKLL